jgi:hypothetical protein
MITTCVEEGKEGEGRDSTEEEAVMGFRRSEVWGV